jgi:hypothetical protein
VTAASGKARARAAAALAEYKNRVSSQHSLLSPILPLHTTQRRPALHTWPQCLAFLHAPCFRPFCPFQVHQTGHAAAEIHAWSRISRSSLFLLIAVDSLRLRVPRVCLVFAVIRAQTAPKRPRSASPSHSRRSSCQKPSKTEMASACILHSTQPVAKRPHADMAWLLPRYAAGG